MKSTDKVEAPVDPVAAPAAAASADPAITPQSAVMITNVDRDNEVLNTIKNHTMAAMGIGILPVPGVDLIALTGVQLNLLRKLGALYDKPFSDEVAKKLLGALLGGYLPLALVAPVASVLKFIPGVGSAAGVLAQSTTAGTTTYAIGKVFAKHFETGGDLVDLNPADWREAFRKYVQEAKDFLKKQTGAAKKEAA